MREVSSWRRRVPSDFEFSVRCYRDLTHKHKLEPVNESYEILSKMLGICKTLEAKVLHIQTPATFKMSRSKANSIRNLLDSLDLKGIRIAWEIRQAKQIQAYLTNLMQDYNIIHCVDLSKEEPAYAIDILYSRLFGKGRHNIYHDEELKTIDRKAVEGEHKKVILSFHGLRMYKDAARFKVYKQAGNFPPVTNSTGLASLREILSEDAKFPATKDELIQHQGWKVFDLTSTKRIHAYEILDKLPSQTYYSIEEVIQTLIQSSQKSVQH